MSCPYATWDAAYVLGALTPEDRHTYEEHLAQCPRCADAVRRLAGLPGLLSRLPADMVLHPAEEPPPDTLLPRLIAAAARQRRRATVQLIVVVTTAAAAVMAFLLVAVRSPGTAPDAEPFPQPSQTMQPVGTTSLHATIRLTDESWGTQIDMRCSYPATLPFNSRATGRWYGLVAVKKSGGSTQLASWTNLPGKEAHVSAATSLRRWELASLQIRTRTGRTILELPEP